MNKVTSLIKYNITIIFLVCMYFKSSGQTELKTKIMEQEKTIVVDNSKKTVLARGCDPVMSLNFAKIVPPLIGNAQYIPTTNDQDFIEKLKTKKWSVIYFAPGACRYSAANHQIPGGISETAGWTLEEYKELIYKYQGKDVQIVESIDERQSIEQLNLGLEKARETN